jgi:maltooligosyltrehalose trehalohydrolase
VKAAIVSKIGYMLGATFDQDQCEFRLWAPAARNVILRLLREEQTHDLAMAREEDGEHFSLTTRSHPGEKYFYIVDDNKPLPDPVSRLLPQGVHGPTEIVAAQQFSWADDIWRGLSLTDYIIYELHIGTFTPEGTLDAAIEKLAYLKKLGATVVELMPVAAFPGARNWGYDGVSPYSVQASYGGPEALRRFVDAAHALGLGVMLDVVYNHLGNEGNYLRLFGPYFTDQHKTPWGEAINYDQRGSKGVRRYFEENALYWIREYHLDGLRLDAVQTIKDESPLHILAEIKERVDELAQELGRPITVIAESDENDENMVRPLERGGHGLDAVWSDDFHHAVHAFFTGERKGYYQDFGDARQILRALDQGFVFQGEPFQFWEGRPRGTNPRHMPAAAHVICIQNHDQVGNRAQGERLTALVPRGVRTLAAALLLLSPHTPLLFMGQEYDEANPFQFFTDYGDPVLQKAVSEGRRNEFKDFAFCDVPDPQDRQTFERCCLNWQITAGENTMLRWYASLIDIRKRYITNSDRTCRSELLDGVLHMQVPSQNPTVQVYARLKGSAEMPQPGAEWEKALAEEADGYAVAVWVRAVELPTHQRTCL